MKVNFDMVRIGKLRSDPFAEELLKENVRILKSSIRTSLEDERRMNECDAIDMVMVIPGKGFNIKIALQDIQDKSIRKMLNHDFPNSIYKGKYSVLLDNINNRIF